MTIEMEFICESTCDFRAWTNGPSYSYESQYLQNESVTSAHVRFLYIKTQTFAEPIYLNRNDSRINP